MIMKAWKISGSILLVIWLVVAAFIWFRSVDGAGVTQTMQLKEITLIGYAIWGIVLRKKNHEIN